MNILAMDTSSQVASVAILNEDKMLVEFTTNFKRNHSETLMPMIDECIKSVDMIPDDIDVVAVSIGPGSFTGLRIGLATAKGIVHTLNKKIVAVSTLESVAYNVPYCDGYICSVVNALRGEVFGAIYKWKDSKVVEVTAPKTFKIEEYIEIAEKLDGKLFLVNDGACVVREKLKLENEKWVKLHEGITMPNARCVGLASLTKIDNEEYDDIYDLAPIYMRKSAAEEKLAEKSEDKKKLEE